MKKISSSMVYVHKRLFPALWFGVLGLTFVAALTSEAARKSAMFTIVPVAMAVFGYFFMKRMFWVLADEVFDCGDHLLVKNSGAVERVYLSNVMNVSVSTFMNPPQITLRLVAPLQSGNEITFSPASGLSLNPFAKNAIAEDLIIRVHAARNGRAV